MLYNMLQTRQSHITESHVPEQDINSEGDEMGESAGYIARALPAK